VPQALGRLEGHEHQVLEFLLKVGAVLLAAAAQPVLFQLHEQLAHPGGDLLQPLHQGLDLLGADRQLLDQGDRLAPAVLQAQAQRPAGELVAARPDVAPEVAVVAAHQEFERLQVVRHPAEDLVLLQVLGHRDLHRAVEGQLAAVDLLEDVDDQAQRVVALQDLAPEPLAGDLDLLGQADLLVAGQQRDLAHLRQVHADRVVDAPGDLVEVLGGEFAVVLVVARLVDEVLGLVVGVGARGQQARLGLLLVDQLDAHLVEGFEQAVDLLRAAGLVGQIVIDLVECQETTPLAQVEERLEALVQLFHRQHLLRY
jgi:hypothetical protein